MNTIFKKLNFKNQPEVHIFQAPESFRIHLSDMEGITAIEEGLPNGPSDFILAFVRRQEELGKVADAIANLRGDGLLWVAYPKKSSKKYTCDFDRDSGWDVFGRLGFEGVRMVAIDEDWSALRLRRVEFIKTMTRSSKLALTDEGKKRVGPVRKEAASKPFV